MPAVFGKGKETEVRGVIIGRDAVLMIRGHALRNEFAVFGDIGGMGSKETFVPTKSISEKQIVLLAVGIVFDFAIRVRGRKRTLHVAYSAGWIDGDTFSSIRVTIERDVVGAMCSDIAEEYVTVCERVTGSGVGVNE